MSSGYKLFAIEVLSNSSGPTEMTIAMSNNSTRSSVSAAFMLDKLGAGHLESYLNEQRQK